MPALSAQVLDAGPGLPSSDVPGAMLHYLGRVAREKRKAQRIKLIRIAYQLDKSEATMSRFESGQTWHDLERAVAAYADEFGEDPFDIWAAALELWRAERSGAAEIASAAQPSVRVLEDAAGTRGAAESSPADTPGQGPAPTERPAAQVLPAAKRRAVGRRARK